MTFPQRNLVALGAAAGVGVLGGVAIILFDRVAVSAAGGVSSSGGLSFGKLVLASIMIWLVVGIPYGMGWLCGAGAAVDSRNPASAGKTGFFAALICLAVVVPVVMAGYEMTFLEWLNLQWATTEGVSSHGYGMAWIHIIPIGTLLVTGPLVAAKRAERPYCETCGAFCASRKLGEIPDLEALAPGAEVTDSALYVDRIVPARPHTEIGERWGDVRLAYCETCKKVGFLSVDACHVSKEEGGNTKVKRHPRATLMMLTEAQLTRVLATGDSVAPMAAS
ncbi:MAG: hypothetical protein Q8K55_15325 [Gemmatimonadaceae bacterium]|nr:hypothetical protein [Gemmatimonadaceae bacterium]